MMRWTTVALLTTEAVLGTVYFEDRFDAGMEKWTASEWKEAESMGEWTWTPGEWFANEAAAKGMMATTDMRFHATSAPLEAPASTVDKDLIVQFTVKHEKKDYAFCGGGYVKLLPGKVDPKTFGGDTPYSIMFGPDLCGYDISRIHLIFEHEGENLLKDEDVKLDYSDKDEYTHLYTLILKHGSGEYEVLLDQKSKSSGKLEDHWKFPKKEIKDPSKSKPADWVDEKKIPDPAAVKPEGYDDIPAEIPDPEAEKPEDWDDEEDGEWEPPLVDNPDYKGEWKAPMIDNPAYKGEWVHPMIPNVDYKPDTYAKYSDLTTIGFELWTVNAGSIFDNVLVTDDKDYADKMADETWKLITDGEKDAKDAWKKIQDDAKKDADDDDEDDEDVEDLSSADDDADAAKEEL